MGPSAYLAHDFLKRTLRTHCFSKTHAQKSVQFAPFVRRGRPVSLRGLIAYANGNFFSSHNLLQFGPRLRYHREDMAVSA